MNLSRTFAATVRTFRDTPALCLLMVTTVGASLFLLGGYIAALQNLERLAWSWGRATAVNLYLADTLSLRDQNALLDSIRAKPEVAAANLVSPKEAMKRFRDSGAEAAGLVEGIPDAVLPATIEVDVDSHFSDLEQVEKLAQEFLTYPGIDEADYGQREFERLNDLLAALRILGVAFGIMVFAIAAFIVGNTIRIAVFARRDEIEILTLVGATADFVRAPFILEGALLGLLGGFLASGALSALERFLGLRLPLSPTLGGLDVVLLTPKLTLGLVTLGIALGATGAWVAVRRSLLDSEPG